MRQYRAVYHCSARLLHHCFFFLTHDLSSIQSVSDSSHILAPRLHSCGR